MKKLLAVLLLVASTPALAQSVIQSGSVTPGHATRWISNGVVGDAGTAASGSITSLGVTNNGGPGVCVNSAPNTGPYNQICLAATTNGGTKISSYAFGGATSPGITFDINGSTQGFPTVTLPVTNNNGACFDGTTGQLKDCGYAPLSPTLTSAHMYVGNASNVATDVAPSGDWTITNTGVNTVAKVNGVAYPASPSTNTVPVVTTLGQITYETVPVAAGGTGATTFTSNLPLIGNGTGAIAQGTRSGNTTSFATTTGTLTSGNCVQIDASGNLVQAAGPCGVTNLGTAGQVAYYATTGTTVSGSSAMTISGGIATLTTPIIDTSVTWKYSGTTVGTESVANPAATSPLSSYVTEWRGQTAGGTTSLHTMPASGTLTVNTITENVTGTTSLQAFGGNYGRWSLTNQGSALSYVSGLFGEYGGTTATGAMGPFLIQTGIENPPSTFTTYEFLRFQPTSGGSEDAQIGAVLVGANQPSPGTQTNRIVLIKPNIGSPGQRDSDAILWEGKANDGTERATWWRQFVDVTSNAGASTFTIQSNLNGAGYFTRATVSDGGVFTANATGSTPQTAASSTVGHFAQASGSASRVLADSYNNGAATASSVFTGRTSRGTASAPSALQSADSIASFNAIGYGSTGYSTSNRGGISVSATQTWTDANQGTSMVLQTTPNNSTTVTTALTLGQDQTATFAAAVSAPSLTLTTTPLAAGSGGTGLSALGTGIATWLGTPSSANLAAALTDETGTGVAVFGTAPTFTTSFTGPVHIGGTGTTSTAEIRATSNSGGTTGADIIFTSGNNGALEMARVRNQAGVGYFGLNRSAPNYLAQLNAPSGTNALMQFTNAATGTTASDGAYFGVIDGQTVFRIYQLENDDILFATNNASKMLLKNTAGTHLDFTGSAPSVSSCGTSPAVTSGSTDAAGQVTTGTATPTSCTITFATAYAAAPRCVGNATTFSQLTAIATTTTTLVFTTTATNNVVINWHCIGA